MQWPLTDPETLFEELLQDLPPETAQMARECKAFVRAKKVTTSAQLVRMVFFYCGLDTSLREVAGILTALYETITDQSVAERWRAWSPWGQAMRRRMLPLAQGDTLPAGRRLVGMDASSLQAPGATGTDHRLPSALDLLSLQCLEGLVRDVHTGATLKHFTLAPGDVARADRGDAQCQGMPAAVAKGAALSRRLTPCSVVLRDAVGAPLALCVTLKRQHMATRRTLAVTLWAAGGQPEVRGGVQAYRLHAEQANRARHTWRQGHKKGPPSAARLLLAGWVLGLTTLAPAGLTAQTIMARSRCRWHVEIARKRWQSVLDVDALRAKATSPLAEVWRHGKWLSALMLERRMRRQLGGQRGSAGSRACGHLVARLGHAQRRAGTEDDRRLFWKEDAWLACLKVLAERPRRRQ